MPRMSPIIVPGTTSTSNPRSSIRRENGLIRRKSERGSWEYEDAEFGDPERIEFDTEDLIDAAVAVYLNPRKSSPTIANPASGLPSRRSAASQRRISVPRTQPSAKTTARLVRGLCSTRSETVLTARSPWLRSSIARSRTRLWVP